MPLIPYKAAFQNSLASLPLVTYQPGETVIVDGSTTGRLLILKKGNVATSSSLASRRWASATGRSLLDRHGKMVSLNV
jgi:hypothetical protein